MAEKTKLRARPIPINGYRAVPDHEATERHNNGYTYVKWVPAESKLQSWVSVYRIFCAIQNAVLELPEGIDHESVNMITKDIINTLAMKHEGEDVWDEAYHRWIEPSDDDEEV